MLFDMMSGAPINRVPFEKDFRDFMSRLSEAEIHAAERHIDQMIEGTEIKTAGWMPGSDWRGTPFQPIFDKAARGNPEAAARCFGILVWKVFMDRPEKWTSGRFEKDGEPIGSRTYFQMK